MMLAPEGRFTVPAQPGREPGRRAQIRPPAVRHVHQPQVGRASRQDVAPEVTLPGFGDGAHPSVRAVTAPLEASKIGCRFGGKCLLEEAIEGPAATGEDEAVPHRPLWVRRLASVSGGFSTNARTRRAVEVRPSVGTMSPYSQSRFDGITPSRITSSGNTRAI